jgi:hypothetical protein
MIFGMLWPELIWNCGVIQFSFSKKEPVSKGWAYGPLTGSSQKNERIGQRTFLEPPLISLRKSTTSLEFFQKPVISGYFILISPKNPELGVLQFRNFSKTWNQGLEQNQRIV